MKLYVFIILFITNLLVYGKSISVGVYLFAPPFSTITDNGKSYYGFNIDLMDSICKRLQWKCVFKATNTSNQAEMLNQGTIDVSFTTTPITTEKSGNYIFSLPYLNSDGQFVASIKNKDINNLKDIRNKKIGVLSKTLYQSFSQSNKEFKGDIKQYVTFIDLIFALSNKDVDVIIINKNVAQYLLLNYVGNFKLVGPNIPMGEGYGLIALKKNNELIKKINSALLDMIADGSYLYIYKTYFGN